MRRCLLILLLTVSVLPVQAGRRQKAVADREYWTEMAYRISAPILSNMSQGKLKKNMVLEVSPQWNPERDPDVAYLEAFGRVIDGITPWLSLPDDETPEGQMRHQLRQWALASCRNAVDPASPDCLKWTGEDQILVDAAHLAAGLLRAPEALWEPLDNLTKQRYIDIFKGLRTIQPWYNNWLLFRMTIEAFLAYVGEESDAFVVEAGFQKMNEWYQGDGCYSDGPWNAVNYYNSYVIHPMILESLEVFEKQGKRLPLTAAQALERMQRFNIILERMISPEGTFPVIGRSLTYRMGNFHSLALAAWKYGLPEGLSNGQVRTALTRVMKNMFSSEENFNKAGYLQLGFVGHQPELSDSYTNNGSLYMTMLVYLPLGLPADHPFWTDPAQEWTSLKAWKGKSFPKDHHIR